MRFCCILLLALAAFAAQATETMMLVEKKRFNLPSFTTFNGDVINDVQVGWESYGKLNKDKSNAILVPHFFSGDSHAAGVYSPEEIIPGYWDAIIGPGKAIDTEKYFVISVDSLVNLRAYSPTVITTGPASINPKTGKPYGLTFPVVTIRDFVNIQKAVLDSLGIERLHAVVGPSMGSLQAIDWASAYPDWVPRMISVIGAGQIDAWSAVALEKWALPIRLDKNWNNGDYYGKAPPMEGIIASMMIITQEVMHPVSINRLAQVGRDNHDPLEPAPLHDIQASHKIVTWLRERATARAQMVDANHLLYLVRANQLFVAGHQGPLREGLKRIAAKSLFIAADKDLLLMPYLAEEAHATLLDLGKCSELVTLPGDMGHLEGVVNIQQHAELISSFLAQKEDASCTHDS